MLPGNQPGTPGSDGNDVGVTGVSFQCVLTASGRLSWWRPSEEQQGQWFAHDGGTANDRPRCGRRWDIEVVQNVDYCAGRGRGECGLADGQASEAQRVRAVDVLFRGDVPDQFSAPDAGRQRRLQDDAVDERVSAKVLQRSEARTSPVASWPKSTIRQPMPAFLRKHARWTGRTSAWSRRRWRRRPPASGASPLGQFRRPGPWPALNLLRQRFSGEERGAHRENPFADASERESADSMTFSARPSVRSCQRLCVSECL